MVYPPCCVYRSVGVGVATPSVRLDTVPLGNDQHSWVLTSEGKTLHNGEVIAMLEDKPVEGDILVRKWWGRELEWPACF